MKRKIFLFFCVVSFIILMGFSIRMILGGSEDDWICEDGQWVKHGFPRAPKPTGSCGVNWQKEQIANPASVYCGEMGGRLEIKTASNGDQFGWCKFNDGRECEEWDYYRTGICGNSSPTPRN